MLSWMRRKGPRSTANSDAPLTQMRSWAPKRSMVSLVEGAQAKKAHVRKATSERVFAQLATPGAQPNGGRGLASGQAGAAMPTSREWMGGAS